MEEQRSIDRDELTGAVIGAAIEVHEELGPGLLEGIYQQAFLAEMRESGLTVESEVTLPVRYKGRKLDDRYRVDFIVEDELVVETKAVAEVTPVHERQLLTYLELTGHPLGLLVNFEEAKLVDGVHRLVT